MNDPLKFCKDGMSPGKNESSLKTHGRFWAAPFLLPRVSPETYLYNKGAQSLNYHRHSQR